MMMTMLLLTSHLPPMLRMVTLTAIYFNSDILHALSSKHWRTTSLVSIICLQSLIQMWTIALFSRPSMDQILSWLILLTLGRASKSFSKSLVSTLLAQHLENLQCAPKKRGMAFDRIKTEITRDKNGSRIYQSVNRRIIAIRMTANQPRVSSKKNAS